MEPLTAFIALLKPAIELITKSLGMAKKGMSKKKYDALLSTVIVELLKANPDLNSVQAMLAVAVARENPPSSELLRVQEMFESAKNYRQASNRQILRSPSRDSMYGRFGAKKAPARKAPVKKVPARKVATKKTAAKKFAARKAAIGRR